MNLPSRGRPRTAAGLALSVCAALAATSFAVVPTAVASPQGTGLVISEVYGGGGNSGATYTHDFVELYNPTGSPISVSGMSVQYRSAASANAGSVTTLSGSVPAGGHYLVQMAQGTGGTTPLPTPDATGTTAMSASSGVVYLARTTTPYAPPTGNVVNDAQVVDLVGYGTTVATYENAATPAATGTATLSNTTSATRDASRTDNDDNSADFVAGAPVPQNTASVPPPPPPPPAERTIAEIQGTGFSSPDAGTMVRTTGVVTAAYPTGGLDGLFLQTAGTGGAYDPARTASDGIFVHGAAAVAAMVGGVEVGDHVEVNGSVTERFGMTALVPSGAGDLVELAEPATVLPTEVAWPGDGSRREALEAMLLLPQGDYTVSDNFTLNRYAEIGIARGTEPLRQPTDVAPFGSSPAQQQEQHNAAARVTLDDGAGIDFLSDAGEDTPLPWLTDDPTIRVGEPVTFVRPVVLDYSFGLWRFQPTAQLTAGDDHGVLPATFGDTRTAGPADVGGDLQVASFNVLNYFTALGVDLPGCTFHYDRTEVDPVTIRGGCSARGAAEREDFERQQAKIVKAVNALGAEVVSLEEVENSARFGHDRDATLSQLVHALNADLGSDEWAFVPSPTDRPDPANEDFIRTAFVYKPAAVTPVGESLIRPRAATGDPFVNARDPLAQVFQPVGAVQADRFMLVVNHFKSKGSAPAKPDANADYGQGGWNVRRTEQANALATWVEQVRTEAGVEKVYLDGDFNSYTFEDPMLALYDRGFTNLDVEFHAGPTYLFNGLVGSLDHGLANAAALASTTGSTVWHINSVESVALEYSRYNYNATIFYDGSTPYRSSDHDPIVFGIDTTPATTTSAKATPQQVKVGKSEVILHADVVGTDQLTVQDGTVSVHEGARLLAAGPVVDGRANVRIPAFSTVGTKVLTVTYDGGSRGASSTTVEVVVAKK